MRSSSPETIPHSNAAIAPSARISTSANAVTFKDSENLVLTINNDTNWFNDIPDPPLPNLNGMVDLLDLDDVSSAVSILLERAKVTHISPISLKKYSM